MIFCYSITNGLRHQISTKRANSFCSNGYIVSCHMDISQFKQFSSYRILIVQVFEIMGNVTMDICVNIYRLISTSGTAGSRGYASDILIYITKVLSSKAAVSHTTTNRNDSVYSCTLLPTLDVIK